MLSVEVVQTAAMCVCGSRILMVRKSGQEEDDK